MLCAIKGGLKWIICESQPPPICVVLHQKQLAWEERGHSAASAGLWPHCRLNLWWWAPCTAPSCCTALRWVFSYTRNMEHEEFHTPSLQNKGIRCFYPSSVKTHLTLLVSSNITRWIFCAGAWAVADTSRRKASRQDFPRRDVYASTQAYCTLQARAIAKNASNSCSTQRFSVFPAKLAGRFQLLRAVISTCLLWVK